MNKYIEIAFLIIVSVMYGTVCMETDIYVPAFPEMKSFFLVGSETIQQILSYNFVGICFGSLLFGPLSDSYGRKKILLLGLILFAVSSWCCCVINNFDCFVFCRFLQGMGAAAPMVITFAIFLEKYETKKVAQLCGAVNIYITGVMAIAPILGSYLNIHFGWKSNFILIAILATFSFVGSLFFITETISGKDRIKFSIFSIIKKYGSVLASFPYMAGSLVCYLMFAGAMVFIANLSLIFIEYLGVPKSSYAFYQASPSAAFALFSLLSIWIIGRFGINKTKHTGIFIALIGTLLFIITSTIPPNPFLICGAMVVYTTGITLAAPIYGMESANVFPEMRGVATGMSNALRYIIIASLVGIGSYTFDGSIKPVAFLLGSSTFFVFLLAMMLLMNRLNSQKRRSVMSGPAFTVE